MRHDPNAELPVAKKGRTMYASSICGICANTLSRPYATWAHWTWGVCDLCGAHRPVIVPNCLIAADTFGKPKGAA